jgi:hypothetical protein
MLGSWRAVPVAALLGLAGCGDVPVYYVTYDDSYHAGETRLSGPDVSVVVRGDPYGISKPAFDSAVIAAMQGWSAWGDHFIPGNPDAAYRVVLVFNPTRNVGIADYCARPLAVDGASGTAPAPRARMVATLCRGGSYLSSADGSILIEGGPEGAAFRDVIGRATLSLFPGQNPTASSDCPNC